MNDALKQILDHLGSSPNARVVVHTTYRYTVYAPKHAVLFSAHDDQPGVYVARGRRREYVYPEYIRFARVA